MHVYKICIHLINLKKKKQFFIIKVLQMWSFKCGEKSGVESALHDYTSFSSF